MTESPSREEIRAALARVLSSPRFARARRAAEFLRYIVEETLAGRDDAISGHAIAMSVFGKPADFDSASDPLVRVEAGRLRSRLIEYYASVGEADEVRIELPRGSYVPTFRFALRETREEARPPPPRRPRRILAMVAALSLLLVIGALGVLHLSGDSTAPPGADRSPAAMATPRRGPSVFVQPFRNAGDQQSLSLAFGMTEEVMTRLARYPDLTVLVGSSGYFDGREPSVESVGGTKGDYVLTATLRASERAIHVEPRLIDARTGQQLWAMTYEQPYDVANVWGIIDELARAVATTVGEPFGPLFSAEVAQIEGARELNADSYHCSLRFLFAVQTMSEDAHARATTCFEHAVASEPMSSTSWARLAALYRMEYLHDFNSRPDGGPALDRALEAARKALDIDYNNALAHEELGFISYLRDAPTTAEESLQRALALDPSADVRAAIGTNFVKMGDTERGFPLIEKGMAESPRAPPFFFLAYVVNACRMNDAEAALHWAQRMATPDWPLSQAILAAMAGNAGQPEIAKRAVGRLLMLRPNFAANGRELVQRTRLGAEFEADFVSGLARAGLVLR